MTRKRAGFVAAAALLGLVACAGKGERVDLVIPAGGSGPQVLSASAKSLRVAVAPFDDARTDRMHLGSRSPFWGGTSYFDLPKGTVGEAVAKALVQQLNRQGWQASLAGQTAAGRPDATITGTIRDLSVNAIGKFGRTDLTVKHTIVIRVANHGDDSTIREQVIGSGSDEVFWFDPEDAEALVNEVVRKNFEKFLSDTKVEGSTIRLRSSGAVERP